MLNLTQNHTPRGIRIEQLCKHLFICGMPGFGKTIGTYSILYQLFERGIPFIVIECAKTEYRRLKVLRAHPDPGIRALAERLEVYSAGNEHLSPLRYNPLLRPGGIDPNTHIDAVLRCFKGAMPMFEPLPALLGEALEITCGEHPGLNVPPTVSELYAASRRVLDEKGYSGDTRSDMSGALESRLGILTRRTLGAMLRTAVCIPDIAHLATSHCIIEIDALEVEIKCLLTLLLLSAIHRHVRQQIGRNAAAKTTPQLVIVIEEAHNIVGRCADTGTAENTVDSKAYATELICRMLAEFRALGVGLILIDQLPSQVAPQVIKNTGTKLAFHLGDGQERTTMANAMLFGDVEYEEIARLLPGEAFLFAEGYHRSHRIRTPNLTRILELPDQLSDEQVAALISGEAWFQEATACRVGDVLLRFEQAMKDLAELEKRGRQKLGEMVPQQVDLAQIDDPDERAQAQRRLAVAIAKVGRQITLALTALEQSSYGEVCRITLPSGPVFAELEAHRARLVRRLEGEIRPGIKELQDFVQKLVARLNPGVATR